MTNTEDLRIVKTKRNIEETFLKLLKDTPFRKMTVKSILEAALINRGTFYHHYLDKYDLAEQIAMKFIKKAVNRLDDALSHPPAGSEETGRIWWQKLDPFSDEMLSRWYLLRSLPIRDSSVEKEYRKALYDLFYRYHKSQDPEDDLIIHKTLACVYIYMGYFTFYEESPEKPSFKKYIDTVRQLII